MADMFTREDWTIFRNLNSLGQRAGVPTERIPLLVAKELADNALDAAGTCNVGLCNYEALGGFYIQDDGPGIEGTDAYLAELFSIKRSYLSSKHIRLPTRGALGNGLRVVTGAVLATDGKLFVSTRGRRLQLIPNDDGTTTPVCRQPYQEQGTRVEVYLGAPFSFSSAMLGWAQLAAHLAQGDDYKGKTSPYWYDSDTFYELLQAAGKRWVREEMAKFDGCSGANAGRIAAAFLDRTCDSLTRDETEQLLNKARAVAKPVKAQRLGRIGEYACDGQYARSEGVISIGAGRGKIDAMIPFVVEVWAETTNGKQGAINLIVTVNKTPITADVSARKIENQIAIFGAGLKNFAGKLGRSSLHALRINIQTPYMPITSDGKEPNLLLLYDQIREAIEKAISRAKRTRKTGPDKPRTQKEIVFANVEQSRETVSKNGRYRFSQRQLFYAIRPLLIDEVGKEPDYDNFCKILTDYENIHGDIQGMYRDARGTLYHPHTGERIPIGTMSVERYTYPEWNFNKILYIEKEGFFEMLIEEHWPEQHDCALLTTKGQATRAAKDLLDLLGEKGEDLTFFCVHDADASGTTIYDALQNETRTRPGRKVKIINLGLEPDEAMRMGLQIEQIEKKKEWRPVGDYVVPEYWKEWLQTKRVELNAMTSDVFLDWLNLKVKIYGNGKLIPPVTVIDKQLKVDAEQAVRDFLRTQIWEDLDMESQVTQILETVQLDAADAHNIATGSLYGDAKQSWRKPVQFYAKLHAEKSAAAWDRKSSKPHSKAKDLPENSD